MPVAVAGIGKMGEPIAERVLAMARESGTELPFTRRLANLLESAVDRGYAELDFTSFLQLRDVPPPATHYQEQVRQ